MDIKKIILDAVRESLPGVVREIVREGLEAQGAKPPRRALAVPLKRRQREPSAASEHGVKVGQRWEGKPYAGSAGRVIEIVALGKDKVTPRVIKSPGKRSAAKAISYAMLTKTYVLK